MIATLAPSLANATATARPIPLSPPVMIATFPISFPAARYSCFTVCGRGRISVWWPGRFR
jgi:hypothetical protein